MNKILALTAMLLTLPLTALAQWDFSKHSIPLDEIVSGGPPKDGIPALTNPKYVPADQADYMRNDEDVLGVSLGGVARAYPIRILSWHEVVNDTFGGEPVLVSW
jgi:hypothetical protein